MFLASICISCLFVSLVEAQDAKFWSDKARRQIEASKKLQRLDKKAKNVILFLGDGMGFSTLTAARVLKGEYEGNGGAIRPLTFETWPHVGLTMTYNTDILVGDSAASATALVSGKFFAMFAFVR